jgi:Uma2 family endonuclease
MYAEYVLASDILVTSLGGPTIASGPDGLMSCMERARKLPTPEDLEALPPSIKGEIIEGVLYTMTRPRGRHQRASSSITSRLMPPFDFGEDGPGGWWILGEPGIELPGTPEISPDVGGWRRERLPELPQDEPIRVVPDWVCEVLSPTTRRHDLLIKRPYYAKIGVRHHWLVDIEAHTITAYVLREQHWLELGTWSDESDARIEPFDAVAIDVGRWCA